MGELKSKFASLANEQIRENLRRTIMSYRSSWDIYTELLQNSVDAIIDKFGFEKLSEGKIELELDSTLRKIVIKDNGVGIKPEHLSSILIMGESIKRKENRGKYGFMGYGFTFVAFQTKYLKIESVYEGVKDSRTFTDLYKFVFEENELPLAEEEIERKESELTEEESYTKITAEFPKEFPDVTLENNIENAFLLTKNERIIEYILRRKSAIGLVDDIFEDMELFEFILTVNGIDYDIKSGYLGTRELIETMFPNSGKIYEIVNYKKFIEQTDHLDEATKKNARRAILVDGVKIDVNIGIKNPLTARFYIAQTSKGLLNDYRDRFLKDEENNISLNVENGLWLSIDGLPTGICLDPFIHPSYLPFTVIVDVTTRELRNELDSGRKGITSYRANQIITKVKDILKEEGFIEYRKYVLGTDTRIQSDGYDPKEELLKKLTQKTRHEELDLIHKYYPAENEQDVISLFTELISKDILVGYEPKVISGYDVYDGLYRYSCDFNEEILLPNDSLGISTKVKNQYHEIDKNIVIEFKTELKKIFKDVKDVKKELSDIDILVCWDVEYERHNEFVKTEGIVLKPVDQSENYFYGITHEVIGMGRNTTFLPIIELKKVLKIKFNLDL